MNVRINDNRIVSKKKIIILLFTSRLVQPSVMYWWKSQIRFLGVRSDRTSNFPFI